mgnify:CR=1 FL=1
MANKKNKVKDVKVEGLDELVNEGKNIDIVKVEEIIANNSEEPTKEEETVVSEEVVASEPVIEKEAEISEEAVVSEPTGEENNDSVEEDYEAIDEVISECTGEIDSEVKEEKKPTEEKEPWYISRARRITDYYNW